MEITHPWFLILAPLAAALLFLVLRRSLADMTPAQRRACLLVRAVLLGCIVLALAGLRWLRRGDDLGVLFVVDDSASISAEARTAARKFVEASLAHRRSHDESGVLGFARRTAVWRRTNSSTSAAWKRPRRASA